MYCRNGQIMSEARSGSSSIIPTARSRTSSTVPTGGRLATWSMTAAANPQIASEVEAVLLAVAAHDLRPPLRILQSVHERLGAVTKRQSGPHRVQNAYPGVQTIDRAIPSSACKWHPCATITASALTRSRAPASSAWSAAT